ncbi:MAG: phosphoribosyl-ATP diphosphatase, partial [Cyanobacteria bacterium P01_F01_bin.42]
QIDGQNMAPPADTLSQVFSVIRDRQQNPSPDSYTCQLFAGGDNKILKKIGEEAAEVVMACKDDEPNDIAGEAADLFYHTLVALAHHNVDIKQVYQKLQERR